MKMIEAIKCLENGKKIRKKYWEKDRYIHISRCGIIVDQNGNNTPTPIDLRDVWEVFGGDLDDSKKSNDPIDTIIRNWNKIRI